MNKKILIIDDDEQDKKGMTVALKKRGYSDIVYAESGQEGIKKIRETEPDIVIIDVVLPDGNGVDICTQIKSLEGFRAKVIMITGHLVAIDAEKARNSGADEIIEKTPGYGNIAQTIEEVFQDIRQEGETENHG